MSILLYLFGFFPPSNAASWLSGCWEVMCVQPAGSEVRVQIRRQGVSLGLVLKGQS